MKSKIYAMYLKMLKFGTSGIGNWLLSTTMNDRTSYVWVSVQKRNSCFSQKFLFLSNYLHREFSMILICKTVYFFTLGWRRSMNLWDRKQFRWSLVSRSYRWSIVCSKMNWKSLQRWEVKGHMNAQTDLVSACRYI